MHVRPELIRKADDELIRISHTPHTLTLLINWRESKQFKWPLSNLQEFIHSCLGGYSWPTRTDEGDLPQDGRSRVQNRETSWGVEEIGNFGTVLEYVHAQFRWNWPNAVNLATAIID